jgi:hypothetical protein
MTFRCAQTVSSTGSFLGTLMNRNKILKRSQLVGDPATMMCANLEELADRKYCMTPTTGLHSPIAGNLVMAHLLTPDLETYA